MPTTITTTVVAAEKPLEDTLPNRLSTASNLSLASNPDLDFDSVLRGPVGGRLEHKTATRAKAPKRRPPSSVFIKDGTVSLIWNSKVILSSMDSLGAVYKCDFVSELPYDSVYDLVS
jgi:hypothetical protein